MTTLAIRHPIYQDGPLAQAITAFQQQQEQSRIACDEIKRQNEAEETANRELLINKANERFGEVWAAISPYIAKSYLSWEREIVFIFNMPEMPEFQLIQQLDGYAKIEFPYAPRLDSVSFTSSKPIAPSDVGRALAIGRQSWLEEEAKRQAKEEQKAKKLAYVKAFMEYEREHISTLFFNKMALALLQEEYTTTFPVWSLTYGITAHSDEEGEFYADTRSVWVLSPDPDDDGFFPVIDDTGKVTHRKYYSLVYLDGPQTLQVDRGSTHCGHLHIKEANDSLYFSPLLNYAEVLTRARGWVEANMHPFPDPPLYAAFGLDERPDRWEIEELEKELSGEGEDEIPF